MGKKQEIIAELYRACRARNDYVFDNELVKEICRSYNFKNPFDATKVDNLAVLPEEVRRADYALIHIGQGRHQFVKGLNSVYHAFEPIAETIEWTYRKSLLNQYNTSESNILSVANNQRILHHFLFGKDAEFDDADISLRPKIYFPYRTKVDLFYKFGNTIQVKAAKIQIRINLTMEYEGVISIFEAKDEASQTFSVYQLYYSLLYYHNARLKPEMSGKIHDIRGVYVVRRRAHGRSELGLWSYRFADPFDITSITLEKAACYALIEQ